MQIGIAKSGSTVFLRIAGWEALDRVIVDDGLSAQSRKWLGNSVANLTLVPAGDKGKQP